MYDKCLLQFAGPSSLYPDRGPHTLLTGSKILSISGNCMVVIFLGTACDILQAALTSVCLAAQPFWDGASAYGWRLQTGKACSYDMWYYI
jgi:hypothetical protein